MGLDLTKTKTSVSDADIIVKLARAGELAVLGRIQETVLIPEKVRLEALKKIGTHSKGPDLADCMKQGWLRVVDIYDSRAFRPGERPLIDAFMDANRDVLGPGELEAAALAHVLGIPLLFSDDRTAQLYIEKITDVVVLRLHEVIALGERRGMYSRDEAVALFNKVNSLQEYPVTVPAFDLMTRANERFNRLKL